MTLPPELSDALEAAAGAGSLLVATDFDGVLAPLVLDPSTSRPLPGTVESLLELAALPGTGAAVVSGRDLATLGSLAGLEDGPVTLIGSHGAESSAAGSSAPESSPAGSGPADSSPSDSSPSDSSPGEAGAAGASPLTDGERKTLRLLTEDLEHLRAELPEVRLETKPSAVVAHTRGMDADAAARAEQAVLDVAARHDGVRVMHGKHVVEMSVHDADKGTALTALKAALGAEVLVYFGDDVTDEDVFTLLGDGDVGVKVGDGDTAAGWRVAEPQDVADALALLVQHRRRH